MENITPQQLWNIMIWGTAGILAFVGLLIGIVIYTSKKARERKQELDALKKRYNNLDK